MQILLPLGRPSPRLPGRTLPMAQRLALTAFVHLSCIALLVLVPARSIKSPDDRSSRDRVAREPARMVFVALPDPPPRPAAGGGGGGGGNRRTGPLPRAQAPGADRLTMPVARWRTPEADRHDSGVLQELAIESRPLASGTLMLAGLPDAGSPLPLDSHGPGRGGGFGSGEGTGIGPGRGAGVGSGTGGGMGGGVFRPGGHVSVPVVVTQVRPAYTFEALRARIQGSVRLELIVRRDGLPDEIRVIASLDPGLDEQAVAAARQWRFEPGRVGDIPVDVLVTIVMDFRVR